MSQDAGTISCGRAWVACLFAGDLLERDARLVVVRVPRGSRVETGMSLRPERIAMTIGGEAGLHFPLDLVPLDRGFYKVLRRGPRHWSATEAFLLSQALPALILFDAGAVDRGDPHGPLIGYVLLLRRSTENGRRCRPPLSWRGLKSELIAIMIAPAALIGLAPSTADRWFGVGNGQLFGLIAP